MYVAAFDDGCFQPVYITLPATAEPATVPLDRPDQEQPEAEASLDLDVCRSTSGDEGW